MESLMIISEWPVDHDFNGPRKAAEIAVMNEQHSAIASAALATTPAQLQQSQPEQSLLAAGDGRDTLTVEELSASKRPLCKAKKYDLKQRPLEPATAASQAVGALFPSNGSRWRHKHDANGSS